MRSLGESKMQGRSRFPEPGWKPGFIACLVFASGLVMLQDPMVRARTELPGSYARVAEWDLPDRQVDPDIEPLDLALAPDGALLVADAYNRKVLLYDAGSRLSSSWDFDAAIDLPPECRPLPLALASAPTSDRVHVLWEWAGRDPTKPERGRIVETRDLEGRLLAWHRTTAVDIAVEPDGPALWLLFRDSEQSRVLRWSDSAAAEPRSDVNLSLGGIDGRSGSLAVARDRIAVVGSDGGSIHFTRQSGVWSGPFRRRSDGKMRLRSLDADADGWIGLVESTDVPREADPLVLRLDPQGDRLETIPAAVFGLAPLPRSGWPYAISAATGELALIGATPSRAGSDTQRFVLQRRRPEIPPDAPIVGAELRAGPPRAACPPAGSRPSALATLPGGELLMLDGRTDQLIRIDGRSGSEPEVLAALPASARDLAVDVDGRIYLSTLDDRILALDMDGRSRLWQADCDCPLGGRIAASALGLHLSRAGNRGIVTFDRVSGEMSPEGELLLPRATGLWPTDLTAWADRAGLVTIDALTGRVRGWLGAEPRADWSAGFRSAPRRLSAGALPDGRPGLALLHEDASLSMQDAVSGDLLAVWRPPPEEVWRPADLALGREGRVYLSDESSHRILAIDPTDGPLPSDPAAPPIADRACRLSALQWVEPSTIAPGERAQATLRIDQACPRGDARVGADVVLLVDRSASMTGLPLREGQRALRAFTEALEPGPNRIGMVAFHHAADPILPLTEDFEAVIRAIDRLEAEGGTDIAAGLHAAGQALLASPRLGKAEAVIVLLSDGRPGPDAADPLGQREALRAESDPRVYAIGLGPGADAELLVALSDGRYYAANAAEALTPIFEAIAARIPSGLNGRLQLELRFGEDLPLVPGSARPSAFEAAGRLRWGRVEIPADGLELRYEIEARRTGNFPLIEGSWIRYEDPDGVLRDARLNRPGIVVRGDLPTPAAVRRLWLPDLRRGPACHRPGKAVDALLLIDRSGSMVEHLGGRSKLALAVAGVRAFAEAARLEWPDRIALLTFDAEAELRLDFAAPPSELDRILATLRAHQGGGGTRIDRGLTLARQHMRLARRPEAQGAIILITDGRLTPADLEPAIEASALIRAEGHLVYAMGLGIEQDLSALERLAGAPERAAYSGDGQGIEWRLRRFARELACLP